MNPSDLPSGDSITNSFRFHHVGCAVKDLDAALDSYAPLLGQGAAQGRPPIYKVTDQNVRVCFMPLGDGSFLELIEGLDDTSPVANLPKKGVHFYHLAFCVPDMDQAIQQLERQRYRVQTEFRSEAFDRRRCAFLWTPLMHLIELVEDETVA